MEQATPHRTLIVANLTASTPFLLQEVQRLAAERPTSFGLLIPNSAQNQGADWSIATATKLLGRAAGSTVDGHVGGAGSVRVDQGRDRRRQLRRHPDLDPAQAPIRMAAEGPPDTGRSARPPGHRGHAARGAKRAQAVHRDVLGQVFRVAPGSAPSRSAAGRSPPARHAATGWWRIAAVIRDAAATTARACRSMFAVENGSSRSRLIAAATLPSASRTGAATALGLIASSASV